MSVNVALDDLRDELARRSNAAYLLTVSDDMRAHCVAVALSWGDDALVMGAGASSVRNATARGQVTLLSPPAPSASGDGGYTLIIDGAVLSAIAPTEHGGGVVQVRPTHAVLHRPAVAVDGAPAHDCAPVYDH